MSWTYEKQEGPHWREKKRWKKDSKKVAESFFCLMKGRSWSCRLKYCGKIVKGYNAVTGEVWPEPEEKDHVSSDLIDETYYGNLETKITIKEKRCQRAGRRFCL